LYSVFPNALVGIAWKVRGLKGNPFAGAWGGMLRSGAAVALFPAATAAAAVRPVPMKFLLSIFLLLNQITAGWFIYGKIR
jgi:hypothetical protein